VVFFVSGAPDEKRCIYFLRTSMKRFAFVLALTALFVQESAFAQGVWRWDQKVLVDSETENLVGYGNPISSTVSYQVNLIPDMHMQIANGDVARLASEDTIYSIQAYIIAYKIESNDNDYHIVLMDRQTGETMVSEIPKPDVSPASQSEHVGSFTSSRTQFLQILSAHNLPAPTTTLNGDLTGTAFKIPVTVIGVGFWDFYGHLDKKSGKMVGHGSGSAVSGREIHPILSITEGNAPPPVTTSALTNAKPAQTNSNPLTKTNPPQNLNNVIPPTISTMTQIEPLQALAYVLLATLMGVAGQLFRVVVGLKKASDAKPGQKTADIFSGSQFLISIGIAAIVGGGAGILAAVTTQSYVVTQSTYFTFLAAGYAGTDFIEGFTMKS
jgi:hypothetical protein